LRIFALAYAKKKPSQPLSRRLRPFYDEIVFRKIKGQPKTVLISSSERHDCCPAS
jgi:hypothetical protein